MVSERIRRRANACALPRPSAMASAKLAKNTVRNSQMVIDQLKMPRVGDGLNQGDDRADQHHEHDRVLHLGPGVQFRDGSDQRLTENLAVEQPARLRHTVGSGGRWRRRWDRWR